MRLEKLFFYRILPKVLLQVIMQNTTTEITRLDRELLDAAAEVLENAYAPYSNFYVGAALRTCDGQIITGTNFENAASPMCICAEGAAVTAANTRGERRFSAIAIIGRGKDVDSENIVSPCGSCRQILNEVAQSSQIDLSVIMSNSQKTIIIKRPLSDLIPLAFGPEDLKVCT